MELGLKGRVALIAAASEGMGKAIALGLALEGADIVMCARREEVLKVAADEVRGTGGGVVLEMVADVSQGDDIKRLVAAAVERFGKLDILVTNAGGPPVGEFTGHDDEAWLQAVDLNLLSVVRLVREALPYLKESGQGRIINLQSSTVKQPVDNLVLSNAVRAGVIGLSKTLANELGPFGITVNNIAPGRINTARVRYLDKSSAEARGITPDEAKQAFIKLIPFGRYGEPEEIANLAVFLASGCASYITGTTIQVDGGMVRSLM